MNNVKCEQIIRTFGHLVKRLVIEDNQCFHVLNRCLGRYGYCPNLQELELTIRKECNEEIPFLMEPFVRHVEGLKIKKLQFEYATKTTSGPKVFQGLLENSPDIENLFIKGKRELTHCFLEILQGKPEIARKLTGFQLEGNILDNFPTLCKIQFGSTLKRIYLHERQFHETLEDGQVKGLAKFLRMVSPTLENLDLCLYYRSISDTADISSLPWMPKLVKLDYSDPSKKIMWHFLKKCPSLKTIQVTDEDEEYEQLMKSCWEEEKRLDGSLDVVPRLIHKGLECIHVGKLIESPSTIQQLNVAFPNLSKLKLGPTTSGYSVKGHQDWFESAFLYCSQMKQLKDLEVDFYFWELDRLIVDLKEAFSNPKDTPNLVKVTFVDLHENEFRAKSISTSLLRLVGAPKLRRIRFECSDIRYFQNDNVDLDLRLKLKELFKELAKSNIHLEVQDIL